MIDDTELVLIQGDRESFRFLADLFRAFSESGSDLRTTRFLRKRLEAFFSKRDRREGYIFNWNLLASRSLRWRRHAVGADKTRGGFFHWTQLLSQPLHLHRRATERIPIDALPPPCAYGA